MDPSSLSERLWDFAARAGGIVDALPDTPLDRHVASQLVRCATAAAPLCDTSAALENREQTQHQLRRALQQLTETRGWLRFIGKAGLLAAAATADLADEAGQLCGALEERLDRAHTPAGAALQHRGLDHVAIVVPDTEAALAIWRDKLGLPLVCSEVVNGGVVRLTHLDLGNAHLQLVQPLTPDHPLQAWLARNGGPGLHHLCFAVENVSAAQPVLPVSPAAPAPHQGTQGKRALFLDRNATQGVQLEITGA